MGGTASRNPIAEEEARAREIQADVGRALVEGDEVLLKRLWAAMQDGVDVYNDGVEYERVGMGWKRWGFQGQDPMTDFRGGGVGTLKWFVYLAESEKQVFGDICRSVRALRAESDATLGFPVFAAAINVYRAALISLHILTPAAAPQPLPTPSPSWHLDPHHVAASLLRLTAKLTLQRRAKYMEFNLTLKEAQAVLEKTLNKGVKDITELNSNLGL